MGRPLPSIVPGPGLDDPLFMGLFDDMQHRRNTTPGRIPGDLVCYSVSHGHMNLLEVSRLRISRYVIRGTDALTFSFKYAISLHLVDDPGYIAPVPGICLCYYPLLCFHGVIVYCLYMSSLFPLLLPFLLFDFRPVLRS